MRTKREPRFPPPEYSGAAGRYCESYLPPLMSEITEKPIQPPLRRSVCRGLRRFPLSPLPIFPHLSFWHIAAACVSTSTRQPATLDPRRQTDPSTFAIRYIERNGLCEVLGAH
jgi:hypothetical protein